jgi:hypothetical protein
LYLVAVGVPLNFIYRPAGLVFTALAIALIIVMDTAFSVLLTIIFLQPITKVLDEGNGVAQKSAGYKSMQKSKWMTMAGAILAVSSSTVLYINAALWATYGLDSQFQTNPWLNILVFGISMDSLASDVGMVFVCGVLKNASVEAMSSKFSIRSARASSKKHSVRPLPDDFVPNSQASEDYTPDDVQRAS